MGFVTRTVDATNSVTEKVEEDDIELIPESPCIDKNVRGPVLTLLVELMTSGRACSTRWPQPASDAGMVIPADGALVEVEGGFCVVHWIVRVVDRWTRWTCSPDSWSCLALLLALVCDVQLLLPPYETVTCSAVLDASSLLRLLLLSALSAVCPLPRASFFLLVLVLCLCWLVVEITSTRVHFDTCPHVFVSSPRSCQFCLCLRLSI